MNAMTSRVLIVCALLLGATAYRLYAMEAEIVPLTRSLTTVPLQIERWQGRDEAPFERDVLGKLGVDEYIIRSYAAPAEPWVSLYVGYYRSQRQGDTIHSPLNCLPGAGWQPVRQGRASIEVIDADNQRHAITVNDFTIQKGIDRQLVLYWYQSHGRVVASEYISKIYMVADAIRLNRTDAALVRVITPIVGEGATFEDAARRRTQDYVRAIFAALSATIPS